MQRRLDVALGLVHRPAVLFLDEPTTGLDPEARAAMWAEIARLAGDEGMTILLTTHYLEEADRLADRIAIVAGGRVVAEGTPDELKGELRGDAVHVELREAAGEAAVAAGDRGCPAFGRSPSTAAAQRARRRRGGRRAGGSPRWTSGCSVAAVTVARPSLDDVYLSYAGRRFAEGSGSTALSFSHSTRRRCGMSTTVQQTWWMTQRQLKAFLRQPAFLFITLVQPVIWLFLFGNLFRRVVELPASAPGPTWTTWCRASSS